MPNNDMNVLVKIDPDGTITYGADDTEHLTSNPTMRAIVAERLARFKMWDHVTVKVETLPNGTIEIYNANSI